MADGGGSSFFGGISSRLYYLIPAGNCLADRSRVIYNRGTSDVSSKETLRTSRPWNVNGSHRNRPFWCQTHGVNPWKSLPLLASASINVAIYEWLTYSVHQWVQWGSRIMYAGGTSSRRQISQQMTLSVHTHIMDPIHHAYHDPSIHHSYHGPYPSRISWTLSITRMSGPWAKYMCECKTVLYVL